MNSITAYLKLAWALKTPFILLLDSYYRFTGKGILSRLAYKLDEKWVKDYFDCDDFAWLYKALASKLQLNGVGFVIGRYDGGLHAWNVALTNEGIYQVEPQNGVTFKWHKEYRPLLVII